MKWKTFTGSSLTHAAAKTFAASHKGRLATAKEYFPNGSLYQGAASVSMDSGDKWAPTSDKDEEWV